MFQTKRRSRRKFYKKITIQQIQGIQNNKGCQNYSNGKCQQNKVQYQKKLGELYSLNIPLEPQQEISINIIRPLPRLNGIDVIVVIVDQFTKMIWLKMTTINISAEGIVMIYRDEIWKLYGIPRKILSDKGPQFTSRFMKQLIKALGTTRQVLTAYHPQTDGQTEQINQEIGMFL